MVKMTMYLGSAGYQFVGTRVDFGWRKVIQAL